MNAKHKKQYVEKVGMLNLGCARNLVDAEEILGRLQAKGFAISDLPQAEVVIVNTCTFIEAAKKESIDAILDLIELKKQGKIKKIIVAGCLAQRYGRELLAEFAEIDAISGVLPLDSTEKRDRYALTPPHTAYVKICESCYNQCSFCVIPQVKGKFVSRSRDAVLAEVKQLDRRGVKEINLIGQDITAYGMDTERKLTLASLLRELAATVKNVEWVRLLYAYPAHVTDELLAVMAAEPKICKYLDLPLQHVNNKILAAMNRRMTEAETRALITKIRRAVPGIKLRTTFITGFPGESEEQFRQLQDFVGDLQFEKLGVFAYSPEEGTPAFSLPGQIPLRTRNRRRDILMQQQQEISRRLVERMQGKTIKVLIDGPAGGEENIYLGRTEHDAPDVDGIVYVHSKRKKRPGDFVDVLIRDVLEYDLVGEST